jgi:hypothetical protein
VIHVLINEVSTEDKGDDPDRYIILDEVILGQSLETGCIGKTLRDQEAGRDRQFIFLGGRPTVNVLEETRKSGFFQRFLKILVPPDKFVKHLNILLYVIHLGRLLCIEDGKRRDRGTIIDVATTGLDETANEQDFKERICIFEEFESTASLD